MRSLFQNLIGYLFLVSCSSAKDVPAFFTFGDSMVEVGNNYYLQTLAKANVSHFGIDFGKPTGRFTNGRTIFDILQQVLGFKNFTPPYLAPTTVGDMLLQGVNYASSAAGIFNITGFYFANKLPWENYGSYQVKDWYSCGSETVEKSNLSG
ncbi:GDSL esterase/lipase At4g16220-like [Malus sylvestris]|uniref:GDSL esterase/lipase At4g16220-like n=1 Tax=Malus sylvestris TaxID=3752 RepID=UPI0021AD2609|nr:GDSL esterase/lipase At4g16220-like [Malus sylvestris]